jgi:hypothetical protein
MLDPEPVLSAELAAVPMRSLAPCRFANDDAR